MIRADAKLLDVYSSTFSWKTFRLLISNVICSVFMFHELRLEFIVRLVNIGRIVDHHFNVCRLIALWYLQVFPVGHILFPKNGMSPIGFDPGTSRIVSRRSTN